MALRRAVAAGNWSAVGTWDGGTTLPQPGDIVRANNFAVAIDQNVTVLELRTDAGGSAIAGGTFNVTASRTITASLYSGSTNVLTFSAASPAILTVNGSAYGSLTGNAHGVSVSNTGTLNLTGNVYGALIGTQSGCGVAAVAAAAGRINVIGHAFGGNSAGACGINVALGGTFSLIGNAYLHPTGAGPAIGAGNTSGTNTITGNIDARTGLGIVAVITCNGSAGTTIINGNVYGGTTSGCYGLAASSTHIVTVNGDVFGGTNQSGIAAGITQTGTGVVTVNGRAVAGSGLNAYGVNTSITGAGTCYVREAVSNDYPNNGQAYATPGVNSVVTNNPVTVGRLTFGSGGVPPLGIGRFFIQPSDDNIVIMPTANGGPMARVGETVADPPANSNVRSGIGSGTLVVPAASDVALGVIYDNGTVGTAELTPQEIADAIAEDLIGVPP